jgi:hypothetical protein
MKFTLQIVVLLWCSIKQTYKPITYKLLAYQFESHGNHLESGLQYVMVEKDKMDGIDLLGGGF